MEYCYDTLGKIVRVRGVLEDPREEEIYWVAVENVKSKEMWALLIEREIVIEEFLTLSAFIRNGGKLDYLREPKYL